MGLFIAFTLNSDSHSPDCDQAAFDLSDFIKNILAEQQSQQDIDNISDDEDMATKAFDLEDSKSSFYYDYISKYYPRAYVIRQKFINMTPKQVAESLNDIVYVFVKEPWFYFQDTPVGFKLTHYWEYVLDQCGILHNFLRRAKVDLKTNKISISNGFDFEDYSFYFYETENSSLPKKQNLLEYLKKNFISAYTAFYSLSFDYAVKFFNEGILLKDIKQANKYFSEIELIFEKLHDTPKESDYYESIKICKELLEILKRKLGMNYKFEDFRGPEVNSPSGDNKSNITKEIEELTNVI